MKSRQFLVFVAVSAFASVSFANINGQWGFAGVPGGENCLACHGSQTFNGLTASIPGAETTNCSPNDISIAAGITEDFEMPLLTVGQAATVAVAITDEAVVCPTADCCDDGDDAVAGAYPPPAGSECLSRPGSNRVCTDPPDNTAFNCCALGITDCTGGNVAGFNASVNVGEFAPILDGDGATDTVLQPSGDGPIPTEISHSFPKAAAGGTMSWSFQFVPPDLATVNEGPTIFVGGNLANGNGFDDGSDKNTNFALPVGITDGNGNFRLPGGCLVCGEGQKPAVNGGCCACMSTSPSSSVALALGLMCGVAFLTTGRRRKPRG